TYNFPTPDAPGYTLGGYSQHIVVDENYVLRIKHDEQQLAAVAPLLCAGITTYSPLRHWNIGKGKKVGVVGIGGLGHMGIKLAHAMGAYVVAFTTSESKKQEALSLGADEVVISKDATAMAAHQKSFDLIINTVAASHNLDPFLTLLKRDGTLTLVGVPETPHQSPNVFNLVGKRRSIAGSMIGSIAETQEMLDFCAEHNIVADIELIRADEINTAYERMLKGDVKYRFVIDSQTLKD
ncbi:NAD(P)-dependent alcohol dehydrogenase, partial [Acinetobacter baumannii]